MELLLLITLAITPEGSEVRPVKDHATEDLVEVHQRVDDGDQRELLSMSVSSLSAQQ